MPTQAQFEGESLEALIMKIKGTYGGRAKIVKAEKIKPGGLKSFVAKERFSVLVEISDHDSTPTKKKAPSISERRAAPHLDRLVQDPSEFAARLARAYGEETPAVEHRAAPAFSLPFPSLFKGDEVVVDGELVQETRSKQSSKLRSKSGKEKSVSPPIWTRLSKKTDSNDDNDVATAGIFSDAFQSELSHAFNANKVSTNEEVNEDDFDTDELAAELYRAISENARSNEFDSPEIHQDTVIDLTAEEPAVVDISKIAERNEDIRSRARNALVQLDDLQVKKEPKANRTKGDPISWLEERIETLTRNLHDDISSSKELRDKVAESDAISKSVTFIIGEQRQLRAFAYLVVDADARLNHQNSATRLELAKSQEQLGAALDGLSELRNPPHIAVEIDDETLTLEDVAEARSVVADNVTYIIIDERWSREYVADMIKAIGGGNVIGVVSSKQAADRCLPFSVKSMIIDPVKLQSSAIRPRRTLNDKE